MRFKLSDHVQTEVVLVPQILGGRASRGPDTAVFAPEKTFTVHLQSVSSANIPEVSSTGRPVLLMPCLMPCHVWKGPDDIMEGTGTGLGTRTSMAVGSVLCPASQLVPPTPPRPGCCSLVPASPLHSQTWKHLSRFLSKTK